MAHNVPFCAIWHLQMVEKQLSNEPLGISLLCSGKPLALEKKEKKKGDRSVLPIQK
jgi:hypothetical protein